MEDRSYMTAFSDAVLSISAIWSVLMTQNKGFPTLFEVNWPSRFSLTSATVGFVTLALASFLGFVRFAALLPHQHNWVIRVHKYFSFLGSATGLPMIAAAYTLQTRYPALHNGFAILGIAGPLLDRLGILKHEIVRESASAVSVIAILVISTFLSEGNVNINAISGAMLYVIGGLAIGTEGKGFLGLRNIDWFHFVLAFGTISLGAGL